MRALSLFVCLLLWAADLPAQLPALTEGTRVRIAGCVETGPHQVRCANRIFGTMVEKRSDNLLIRQKPDGSVAAVPLNSIRRLHTPAGRKRHTLTVAAIGFILGGAAGGVIGQQTNPGTPSSPGGCINATMWIICTETQGEPSGFGRGALIGAAVGTGVGALIGTFITATRWEEVPQESLRVTPVIAANGRFGLSASVRF